MMMEQLYHSDQKIHTTIAIATKHAYVVTKTKMKQCGGIIVQFDVVIFNFEHRRKTSKIYVISIFPLFDQSICGFY